MEEKSYPNKKNEIVLYQSDNAIQLEVLIDNDLYHIGASIKDLGKKLFAFSKMEMTAKNLLNNM